MTRSVRCERCRRFTRDPSITGLCGSCLNAAAADHRCGWDPTTTEESQ